MGVALHLEPVEQLLHVIERHMLNVTTMQQFPCCENNYLTKKTEFKYAFTSAFDR
jgi:hypothetical protein